MRKSESKQLNQVIELLKSARADIAKKNFAAAVAAISAAINEIEPGIDTNDLELKAMPQRAPRDTEIKA